MDSSSSPNRTIAVRYRTLPRLDFPLHAHPLHLTDSLALHTQSWYAHTQSSIATFEVTRICITA